MLKEKYVTVRGKEDNRDNGKRFLVQEMPAYPLEKWGVRALMALGTSGISVPQDLADAGVLGIALLGYQVFMGARFEAVEPLMDEMLACVKYHPEGSESVTDIPRGLILEVSTIHLLRREWLELHTGFTLAELALKLKEAISAKVAAAEALRSQNTSISPE